MSGDAPRSTIGPRAQRNAAGRPDWARIGFFAVLAVWIVLPFSAASGPAQDALPYVVAGRLLPHHPGDVYPGSSSRSDVTARFGDEYCKLLGSGGPRCDEVKVAYLATPLALPFAAVIGHASGATASLIMRLAAAVMLAAGMALLWERLAHRTRRARLQLLITAIALTPMATTAIGFGQTSPVMFVSVCLGLGATTRFRRGVAVAAWVGASIFKAFPAALVLVLLWLRRWRFLVAAAGAFALLVVATSLVAPASTVADFVHSSSTITGSAVHGSLDALVRTIVGDTSWGIVVARVVAIVAAVGCGWVAMRDTSADVRWAGGYVALLLLSPLMQLHYLWVPIGGIAVALAAQRRLDDRLFAILTAASVLTIPPSLVPDPTAGSYPTYLAIVLIITAAAFSWLAYRSRTRSPLSR